MSTDHAFKNRWSQKMETLVLQKMYVDKKNMNLNFDIRV